MQNVLFVLQIIFSVTIVVMVLMQPRGSGFARSSSSTSFTRRGLEKLLFRATFFVSAAFIAVSILQLTI